MCIEYWLCISSDKKTKDVLDCNIVIAESMGEPKLTSQYFMDMGKNLGKIDANVCEILGGYFGSKRLGTSFMDELLSTFLPFCQFCYISYWNYATNAVK